MNIWCKLGKHKHVERHRHLIKEDTGWFRSRNGEKIDGSDFSKGHYVVIHECERDDCTDQIAFKEVRHIGGNQDGHVETKERIHPELAKEEMFSDKV